MKSWAEEGDSGLVRAPSEQTVLMVNGCEALNRDELGSSRYTQRLSIAISKRTRDRLRWKRIPVVYSNRYNERKQFNEAVSLSLAKKSPNSFRSRIW
jgi:hypothetical protein